MPEPDIKWIFPVVVNKQRLKSGWIILSIDNLTLTNFMSRFAKDHVSEIILYWIDGDYERINKIEDEMSGDILLNKLAGLDLPVFNLEFTINNEIKVSSDLKDRIFCRIPAHLDTVEMIARLKYNWHEDQFWKSRN